MAIPSKTEKVPEMVERVARALATAAGAAFAAPSASVAVREFGWDADGVYMRQYVDRHWREHVHAARLAIEAMREPTDAMLVAAECAAPELTSFATKNNSPSYIRWQGAIDEALK